MSKNIEIVKSIIEICSDSLETDKLSEPFTFTCKCGKEYPNARKDLWQPIGRSDTYMIRNTLQSLLDIGGVNEILGNK